MSFAKVKVPLAVSACIICLAIGVAGGVFGMTIFGYAVKPPRVGGTDPKDMPPGMMMGMNMKGGKGMKGMKGKGKGGGMFMMGMNNPKAQLASLLAKMDQLTQKPLKLELTKEQQQKVLEVFQGLADKKELTNDEADEKLKVILESLKDHQNTLQAVGVRLPGQMDPPPAPNPFQLPETQKHLESLKKKFGVGQPL